MKPSHNLSDAPGPVLVQIECEGDKILVVVDVDDSGGVGGNRPIRAFPAPVVEAVAKVLNISTPMANTSSVISLLPMSEMGESFIIL